MQGKLCDAAWVNALSGHLEYFIDVVCCPRVSKPDLACGAGSDRLVLSFSQWKCANSKCTGCGINKKHEIERHDSLSNNNSMTDLLECKYTSRASFKSNGE